jgi:hypothetical protein
VLYPTGKSPVVKVESFVYTKCEKAGSANYRPALTTRCAVAVGPSHSNFNYSELHLPAGCGVFVFLFVVVLLEQSTKYPWQSHGDGTGYHRNYGVMYQLLQADHLLAWRLTAHPAASSGYTIISYHRIIWNLTQSTFHTSYR